MPCFSVPRRFAVTALAGLTAACVAPNPEATSQNAAEPSIVGVGKPDSGGGACSVTEQPAHPLATLTGTVCGQTVNLTTRAGSVIQFGRQSLSDPEDEIRVIALSDGDESDATPTPRDLGIFVNLAFETGPTVAEGVSSHNLSSGLFSLCQLGTLVFAPGPVTFELGAVRDGAREGEVALRLSGLVVAGYSTEPGQLEVDACGGQVDLFLQGTFLHR